MRSKASFDRLCRLYRYDRVLRGISTKVAPRRRREDLHARAAENHLRPQSVRGRQPDQRGLPQVAGLVVLDPAERLRQVGRERNNRHKRVDGLAAQGLRLAPEAELNLRALPGLPARSLLVVDRNARRPGSKSVRPTAWQN